ncbi:hypothetical protein [Mycobacterium montefiorense]|uniref:DUF1508 domain-containing protein n=1 Tax=Mycobacterium montefiorense TaxID=154654 RepID=A0AA37UX44_9MYCO|nr:hypothetical protein [Mycobacterium montefiorense]GBG35820.1 hypothetical protein MmonteBS_01920 [Mycobacterium montefiorense]GKU35970.1 hypothetical protein NJB14191_33160 [Mycobacterium montefiorense]GKU41576.1 hypothetical protein NJB14192_35600 [Mycobacterium montefiorense]GKU44410.1 hypothetical protein NJB14194_10380 [Mycobacterium montefiorense]GKU51914.1 hypothetical protein NJB14195_31580 [Mycobacterium montefiorense]
MGEHDDSITAFKDGKSWRWRAPWASNHDSTAAYTTKAKALAAGRSWLRKRASGQKRA